MFNHRKTRWQEAVARENLRSYHHYPQKPYLADDIKAKDLSGFHRRCHRVPRFAIAITVAGCYRLAHNLRDTPNSISVDTASANFPAKSPLYPSPSAVRTSAIIPGNNHAPKNRQIRNS